MHRVLKKERKKKVSGSFWILVSKFIHMASAAQLMCIQQGGRTCTRYVQVILYRNTFGGGGGVKLIIKNNMLGVIKLKTFTKVGLKELHPESPTWWAEIGRYNGSRKIL